MKISKTGETIPPTSENMYTQENSGFFLGSNDQNSVCSSSSPAFSDEKQQPPLSSPSTQKTPTLIYLSDGDDSGDDSASKKRKIIVEDETLITNTSSEDDDSWHTQSSRNKSVATKTTVEATQSSESTTSKRNSPTPSMSDDSVKRLTQTVMILQACKAKGMFVGAHTYSYVNQIPLYKLIFDILNDHFNVSVVLVLKVYKKAHRKCIKPPSLWRNFKCNEFTNLCYIENLHRIYNYMLLTQREKYWTYKSMVMRCGYENPKTQIIQSSSSTSPHNRKDETICTRSLGIHICGHL
ncbi:Hypothetical predicted protein, partial [Paramuricea clavata]